MPGQAIELESGFTISIHSQGGTAQLSIQTNEGDEINAFLTEGEVEELKEMINDVTRRGL